MVQQLSCALQRKHAVSYIRNLSIARNEMRPSGLAVSAFDYEEVKMSTHLIFSDVGSSTIMQSTIL
jgi:hypothetical protein